MNAIANTRAVERVIAGAEFLDRNWPDWWMDVELDQLDLSSTCNCVLGQLGCDYSRIENHFPIEVPEDQTDDTGFALFEFFVFPHLGLQYRDMVALGFESGESVDYDDLQSAWVDIITDRRLAASIV